MSVPTLSLVVMLMSIGVASSSVDMSMVLWWFSYNVKMIFEIQKYTLNLTKHSHNKYEYSLAYRDDSQLQKSQAFYKMTYMVDFRF